jgi:hypothetical protein
MLLSGHIIIRNAEKYDYPFRESCYSVLPILDELIIHCAPTDDKTVEWCEQVKLAGAAQNVPIYLYFSEWWNKERGGEALADATNYCIERCASKYHFQFQADQVLHEDETHNLRRAVATHRFDLITLGIVNFWGSFDNVTLHKGLCYTAPYCARRSLYPAIRSIGDACALGFAQDSDRAPLQELNLAGTVDFRNYGLVRKPRAFLEKFEGMIDLYNLPHYDRLKEAWQTRKICWSEFFNCIAEEQRQYTGTHPAVMKEWIEHRQAAVAAGDMDFD